jgi:hypothetical protein
MGTAFRFWGLPLSLLLLLPVAVSVAGGPAAAKRVAVLIARLGSEEFAEREAAGRELSELGPQALDALRQAARCDDPEIARRARALVAQVEKRIATDRLLQPRKVRLVYSNTPLQEAVADFARQTGCPLVLEGEPGKALDRTLSLDTGEVPFWDAFVEFCQKAGLAEKLPETTPAVEIYRSESHRKNRAINLRLIQLLRQEKEDRSGLADSSLRPLIVCDGKPVMLPSCVTGPFRIRALPVSPATAERLRRPGETFVILDAAAAGGVAWQGIVDARITRARDEHGQLLTPPVIYPGEGRTLEEDADGLSGDTPPHLLVRLRQGEKPATRLAEVQGALAVRVRPPASVLLTVDSVAQAAGRTFPVGESGRVHLRQVWVADNGQTTLHLETEGTVTGYWELRDAAGRAFAPVRFTGGRCKGDPLPVGVRELCFAPQPGQGRPATLVLLGDPPLVDLEVPFRLTNVPVP